MTALRLILYAGIALELLLLATLATAAPRVSWVSGTLANGQTRRLSPAGRPIKLAEPGP